MSAALWRRCLGPGCRRSSRFAPVLLALLLQQLVRANFDFTDDDFFGDASIFEHGAPLVVHVGPSVGVDLDRGGFPLRELLAAALQPPAPPPAQLLLRGTAPAAADELLKVLSGRLEEPAARPGGFEVNEEDGHFKLRAKLPGYRLREPAASNGDALSVRTVGRAVVVEGQKADEHCVRRFQRSFRLPRAADTRGIAVTYNGTDGALAVDIPPLAEIDQERQDDSADSWVFDASDGGSQTSLAFLSDGLDGLAPFESSPWQSLPVRPSLRGTFVHPLLRRHVAIDDMFETLLGSPGSVARGTGIVLHTDRRHDEQSRFPSFVDSMLEAFGNAIRMDEGDRSHDQGESSGASSSQEASRGNEGASEAVRVDVSANTASQKKSGKVHQSSPVLVQQKDAKPYWRVHNSAATDRSFIDVHVPDGVDIDLPHDRQVSTYLNSDANVFDGERSAAGKLELPVDVVGNTCAWLDTNSPAERVLRCEIMHDDVKMLPIKVVDSEEL